MKLKEAWHFLKWFVREITWTTYARTHARTNEPMSERLYALSKNNKCHAHWRAWNYVYAIKMNKRAKTPGCEPNLNGPSEVYADRLRRDHEQMCVCVFFCRFARLLARLLVYGWWQWWQFSQFFHKALMEIQRNNKCANKQTNRPLKQRNQNIHVHIFTRAHTSMKPDSALEMLLTNPHSLLFITW